MQTISKEHIVRMFDAEHPAAATVKPGAANWGLAQPSFCRCLLMAGC